ncbi:hypothetical protein WG922_21515 [Ramlibacter sp. AN1015]|uniref:hypothetical protein n=1 Tax=Ramlibacter sp. AN1015 TaxID=3133428 RepID=UPI0030C25404
MRKRCKRKVYGLVNPILHALQGAAITDVAALNKLRVREVRALEAFQFGRADLRDWQDLVDMLNIAETMARGGIGPEVLPVCEQAQEALLQAGERQRAGKRMGVDGPGLVALRELAEYHDLQRTSVSRAEYERAITRTSNRIRGAAPEVKVLG